MNGKWAEHDIPSQDGRVAVVTGANTGLGFATAQILAARGASVVLAARDVEKGNRAAAQIAAVSPGADLAVQHLDLTSMESIRAAAAELHSDYLKIDLLINNAGVMAPPKSTTRDGFELQFGTNHLGHFAFTGLLLDLILSAPASRVVTVSSLGHRNRSGIHFDDLQWEQSYDRLAAYGQSKLANLMFTYELQRRLTAHGSSTIAVAAHPGWSDTDLARHFPAALRLIGPVLTPLTQKPAMGALPTLRAATDPGVLGGQYYGPGGRGERTGHPRPVTSSTLSYDIATQRRLWAISEDLTSVTFPI